MDTSTQAVASESGIYNWQIPGKSIQVQLNLEVIDNLLPEMMRAFGAVPKRGAEVGGLLIGSIEHVQAGQTIVRIEQVELVPCVYARGPSYLLTAEDRTAFDQARERSLPDPSRSFYAVGYFRSHTRDGLSLSQEDVELLDQRFSDPSNLALLVRPFVTKPIQAGFFFRENGSFQAETPLPFIFSRKELGGEPPAPRVSELTPGEPQVAAPSQPEVPTETITRAQRRPYQGSPRRLIPLPDEISGRPVAVEQSSPELVEGRASKGRRLPGWLWIPVSLALLAIGAVAGFEAPKYIHMNAILGNSEDFSLGLAVSQKGDSLTVRWNSDAPAIRSAQSGILEIEDDGYSKPVDLDSSHLQTGSIVYRNTSPSVRFRLTVYEAGRVSITENTEWSR